MFAEVFECLSYSPVLMLDVLWLLFSLASLAELRREALLLTLMLMALNSLAWCSLRMILPGLHVYFSLVLMLWLVLKLLVCNTLESNFYIVSLLSDVPIFLEPAIDFRFFMSSRSIWIRLNSFGSVNRECSCRPVMLNFFEAGDSFLLSWGVLLSLKVFCCEEEPLLLSTVSF